MRKYLFLLIGLVLFMGCLDQVDQQASANLDHKPQVVMKDLPSTVRFKQTDYDPNGYYNNPQNWLISERGDLTFFYHIDKMNRSIHVSIARNGKWVVTNKLLGEVNNNVWTDVNGISLDRVRTEYINKVNVQGNRLFVSETRPLVNEEHQYQVPERLREFEIDAKGELVFQQVVMAEGVVSPVQTSAGIGFKEGNHIVIYHRGNKTTVPDNGEILQQLDPFYINLKQQSAYAIVSGVLNTVDLKTGHVIGKNRQQAVGTARKGQIYIDEKGWIYQSTLLEEENAIQIVKYSPALVEEDSKTFYLRTGSESLEYHWLSGGTEGLHLWVQGVRDRMPVLTRFTF